MFLFFAIEGETGRGRGRRQLDKQGEGKQVLAMLTLTHIKKTPKTADGGSRIGDGGRDGSRTWKQNWICPAILYLHEEILLSPSLSLSCPRGEPCWTRLMRFSWPLIRRWNILRIRHAGQSKTFNCALPEGGEVYKVHNKIRYSRDCIYRVAKFVERERERECE